MNGVFPFLRYDKDSALELFIKLAIPNYVSYVL